MAKGHQALSERSEKIGSTIYALRMARGWSHATLAEKATELAPADEGISPKTVGNMEKGRHAPTLVSLIAIAAALEVEIWQLFLPPSKAPAVMRDAVHELLRRDAAAQQTVLDLILKIPAAPIEDGPAPRPTHAKDRRVAIG